LESRCLLSSGLTALLVADIVPGTASSYPSNLTVAGGVLYFDAQDATGSLGLYKTDGTAAGTLLLKGGVASGYVFGNVPFAFAALNGAEFFTPPSGFENGLWRTDGTPAGTALVMPLPSDSGNATGLTAVGKRLLFSADNEDGVHGRELWVYDATVSPPSLNVIDLDPGTTTTTYTDKTTKTKVTVTLPNSSDPEGITAVNGAALFVAFDGKTYDLWKSDGTAAGTAVVKGLSTQSGLQAPPVVVNGVMYFGAGGSLWRSDGTAAGTAALKNLQVSDLTHVGGTLFFRSGAYLSQLWKSDGTSNGTVLIKDFNYSSNSDSAIQDLTASNGTLYFSASDAVHERQLWRSDGTAAGTFMVKQIFPGPVDGYSGLPAWLTDVNGLLYFSADDGVHGAELWQSDGTAAGTVMVQDIYPGVDAYGNPNSSDPGWLVAFNGKLYFAATDATHGTELWDPPAVPTSVTTTNQAQGPAQSAHPIRGARHPLGPAHHAHLAASLPLTRRRHHGLSS
jgi:ELWxxDGT repeat protein